MCDRVVIIDHGKVIAEDSCEGLYRLLPGANVLQLKLESKVAVDGLRTVAGVEWCEQIDLTLRAGLSDLERERGGTRLAHTTRLPVPPSRVGERADLETVFLTILTGRSLRDA